MKREEAEKILMLASEMNCGPWIEHSRNVARLAESIASKVGLDSEKAYVIGLLHDIGRRGGEMQASHALEGIYDLWDCEKSDVDFVDQYLKNLEYDDYDKLIQLCDTVSLATGYCYIEKKMG